MIVCIARYNILLAVVNVIIIFCNFILFVIFYFLCNILLPVGRGGGGGVRVGVGR